MILSTIFNKLKQFLTITKSQDTTTVKSIVLSVDITYMDNCKLIRVNTDKGRQLYHAERDNLWRFGGVPLFLDFKHDTVSEELQIELDNWYQYIALGQWYSKYEINRLDIKTNKLSIIYDENKLDWFNFNTK